MTNPSTLGHISSSFHDQNAKQKHPKNQKQPARPYAKSSFRLKMGRVMGQKPHWPETLHTARLRYAKRFLDYLRRARKTRRTTFRRGRFLGWCGGEVQLDFGKGCWNVIHQRM